MRSLLIAIASIALAATIVGAAGDAGQDAERQLKTAMNTELVDGNLKLAIEQYKKVAASANRSLAAQALMHMAECYQKLGDKEAQAIYERLVRDYGDQKELAVIAQGRLVVAEPTRMTSGRIATVPVGGIGYGTVSPDGRYFPYTNWDSGDLYLRDLVTGTNRRLTNGAALYAKASEFAVQAVFSKDGRHVAYGWSVAPLAELRIVDVTGAAIAPPRRLYGNDDISAIWPDDWSVDGKWLAVQVRRLDKTAQIGVVNVHDGALRVLKSVDWRGARRLMFSPDGKYLAYDLPVSDSNPQRDVYILAIDGSREVGAVIHPGNDVVMGWSIDGSRLLFASDRSGAVGLWQLPVADGRPQGTPDLIKSNVEGAPLGISRNGALYSLVHHPSFNSAVSSNIHVATFDFETGKFLSPPVAPVQSFIGTNNLPAWAPDGKSLAYVSMRVEPSGAAGAAQSAIIAIRSVETGDVRELRPTTINLYPPMVRWSADGLSLVTQGKDVKGRQGLYRIDAKTGAVTVVAHSASDSELRSPVESPDGKRIYYIHDYFDRPEREFAIIERDLANGHEREVVRGRGVFMPVNASVLSPDGQRIVVGTSDAATNSSALLVVPVHGGQPKEVIRIEAPRRLNIQSWTPNGQGILVRVSSPDGGAELWKTSIDGGAPRKLDLKVEGMMPFSVHPDGRQIAYGVTERAKDDEVWVLENFLPAQANVKPTAKK